MGGSDVVSSQQSAASQAGGTDMFALSLYGDAHRNGCEQQCILCHSRAGLFPQHPIKHPHPLSSCVQAIRLVVAQLAWAPREQSQELAEK